MSFIRRLGTVAVKELTTQRINYATKSSSQFLCQWLVSKSLVDKI